MPLIDRQSFADVHGGCTCAYRVRICSVDGRNTN